MGDVTAGMKILAQDKRPEATLVIDLSKYALQHQSWFSDELMLQVQRGYSIDWSLIEFMTQG